MVQEPLREVILSIAAVDIGNDEVKELHLALLALSHTLSAGHRRVAPFHFTQNWLFNAKQN